MEVENMKDVDVAQLTVWLSVIKFDQSWNVNSKLQRQEMVIRESEKHANMAPAML